MLAETMRANRQLKICVIKLWNTHFPVDLRFAMKYQLPPIEYSRAGK